MSTIEPAAADTLGDHLLTLLRRAPDGLEREELLEQSGYETPEFRAALANLDGRDAIAEQGDRIIAAADGEPAAGGEVDLEVGEAQPAGAEPPSGEPKPLERAPATGPMYRAHFSCLVQFGATRGENRDARAMERAKAIGGRLAEFTGGAVELESVEAYDAARVVWPPPEEDPDEPK